MEHAMDRSDAYRERVVDAVLDAYLQGLSAVAIEGPKAVGKTATASRKAATVFELDRPHVRELAEADFGQLLRSPTPILFDEWQRYPPSQDLIRRAVDADTSPGQFILTGSASPSSPPTHTGAMRIVRLRMRPMTLFERGVGAATVSLTEMVAGSRPEVRGQSTTNLEEYADEIFRSGFPAIRSLSDRLRSAQLRGYVDRIVDQDFAELGMTLRKPVALRRWMAAYAAAISTTAAADRIRNAATPKDGTSPAKQTASAYRDALERMWIVEPVPAWIPSRNHLGQLGMAPKHQLADPALAATLLGLDKRSLLGPNLVGGGNFRDGTFLGALFESLVTLNVRVFADAIDARTSHLRVHRGNHEIDLIVEGPGGQIVALEVKLSGDVNDDDVRHLTWLQREIGDDLVDAAVITTGEFAYRRTDGIAVIPAALLGP